MCGGHLSRVELFYLYRTDYYINLCRNIHGVSYNTSQNSMGLMAWRVLYSASTLLPTHRCFFYDAITATNYSAKYMKPASNIAYGGSVILELPISRWSFSSLVSERDLGSKRNLQTEIYPDYSKRWNSFPVVMAS